MPWGWLSDHQNCESGMIHINLLPVRQIKKKIQARKRVFGLGITFLAVLALLGVVALVLGFKVGELQASIVALQKEKAKYQTTINQIEQLKKDQTLLETKLNTISQLKKGSQLAVRVMDEFASLTPSSRLWINSMSFGGAVLRISGIALDNATIADFMETIVTSPFFESVQLSGTSTTNFGGRKLKSFSFSIKVINADYEPEPAKEESGKQKS